MVILAVYHLLWIYLPNTCRPYIMQLFPLFEIAGFSIEHLYPFGLDAGDTLMNRNDDGSDLVELTVVFPFFDEGETTIFVRSCYWHSR